MGNIRRMVLLLMSLANVDQTQLTLPCLPDDGAIIGVFLKWRLEYKSPYMSRNVHPNMVMVTLWNLIETPLYKDMNVTIHHLFALHMNLKSKCFTYNNARYDNSDFDNEKIHCTQHIQWYINF
jgi:hypothetical protein